MDLQKPAFSNVLQETLKESGNMQLRILLIEVASKLVNKTDVYSVHDQASAIISLSRRLEEYVKNG